MSSTEEKIPMYPDIRIETKVKPMDPKDPIREVKISTTLRIKHEGVWYDQPMISVSEYTGDFTQKEEDEALARFHREVYFNLICTKVSPDIVDKDNNQIYVPSEDQRPETERMLEVWTNKFKPKA